MQAKHRNPPRASGDLCPPPRSVRKGGKPGQLSRVVPPSRPGSRALGLAVLTALVLGGLAHAQPAPVPGLAVPNRLPPPMPTAPAPTDPAGAGGLPPLSPPSTTAPPTPNRPVVSDIVIKDNRHLSA